MTKLEAISQIMAMQIPDTEKSKLIFALDTPTEEVSTEPKEFEKIRFAVFNQEICIYKRVENPHEAEDAVWMYGVLVKRGQKDIGKAVFFDETDRFGKKGWLYFDPDTNPHQNAKEWAKYYARLTDCCRYLLGIKRPNCSVTFEEVREGKKTFRDFCPDGVEIPQPQSTFDPLAEFDDSLPFT